MFKLALYAAIPALVLSAAAAEARDREAVDSPSQLYVKCTTVGTKEYDGRQCTAFRSAANREIEACMSRGATGSHGYRALHVKCVELQSKRFTDPNA